MLKNTRLLKAIKRQPVDQTPVWMMRQAGRYLPEYLALRQQQPDFLQFCQTPALAAEATLQPIERFGFDAAIIFSDILTVPAAMGQDLSFVPQCGPVFSSPLKNISQVKQLKTATALSQLDYVAAAITEAKQVLAQRVPLIGFSGSPWTLACYMVEGQGSKMWTQVLACAYQQPAMMTLLIEQLTEVVVDYLLMQYQAGADVLMLFDSWGGILPYDLYQRYSLMPLAKIAERVKQQAGGDVPMMVFSRQAMAWLSALAGSGYDAVGIDASISLAEAKAKVGSRVALQGNLPPQLLFADESTIDSAVQQTMQVYQDTPGHIFNLAHGIDKDTPISGVEAMLRAVRLYGRHQCSQGVA